MKFLLFVGGVSLLVWSAQALWVRWHRDWHDPALEIKPPTYRYFEADEALAARTTRRREAATSIRARAQRVESGTQVYEVLKHNNRSA